MRSYKALRSVLQEIKRVDILSWNTSKLITLVQPSNMQCELNTIVCNLLEKLMLFNYKYNIVQELHCL